MGRFLFKNSGRNKGNNYGVIVRALSQMGSKPFSYYSRRLRRIDLVIVLKQFLYLSPVGNNQLYI